MRSTAIILGGGKGERINAEVPKQFLYLCGKPMIVYCVETFARSPLIDDIVIVVPSGWERKCAEMVDSYCVYKKFTVISGGDTRQLSCWQALQWLHDDPPQICVIHDAARPLVTEKMIDVAVREGAQCMTFVLPTIDTIVECSENEIKRILDRQQIYNVQTPQAFPFSTLYEAHLQALKAGITDASDDAGLVIKAGNRVKVFLGDQRNIKITTSIDLELAIHYLQRA